MNLNDWLRVFILAGCLAFSCQDGVNNTKGNRMKIGFVSSLTQRNCAFPPFFYHYREIYLIICQSQLVYTIGELFMMPCYFACFSNACADLKSLKSKALAMYKSGLEVTIL